MEYLYAYHYKGSLYRQVVGSLEGAMKAAYDHFKGAKKRPEKIHGITVKECQASPTYGREAMYKYWEDRGWL